tara:strand:+ start:216 stop:629 length:414 start_codon:yes stop_codon:yes gene_type:complete
MTTAVWIYIFYTIISIAMTIWVARTLHKNGRIFLLEAFKDNEEMADSVNHLLVVGFYLMNFGFILLFLHYGVKPENLVEGIEYIATKVGIVLIALGITHFFNMFNFDRMRKKGRRHAEWERPTGTPPPRGKPGTSVA